MKNPKITLLVILTLLAASFTLGLYLGRNYGKSPLSVSVPEEFRMPAPTVLPVSSEENEGSGIPFPIDINDASVQELASLPGIGEGLAEEIVRYRELNGPFPHVEALMNVPGIGQTRLEAILSLITAGGTQ